MNKDELLHQRVDACRAPVVLGFVQETLSRLLVAHIEEDVLLSQTYRRF